MIKKQLYHVRTISEFHQAKGLPKPQHPSISLVDFSILNGMVADGSVSMVWDFYVIALVRDLNGKMRYGQLQYDFDEGVLLFSAPGQLFRIETDNAQPISGTGWMLLIHPDFLWHTPLAKTIRQYEFFGYAVNEALFLSDKEETVLTGIIRNIEQEYHSHIDTFTHGIIIAQLESLLSYAERFYHRQFLTRRIASHQVLEQLDTLLDQYFAADDLPTRGLPSVQYLAEQLHLSPKYLSSLLKTLTGHSTQQHIHEKLIEKAKQQLSTTDLSVSQIAYALGFEHSQSFSKLFKSKTNLSPLAFRAGFN